MRPPAKACNTSSQAVALSTPRVDTGLLKYGDPQLVIKETPSLIDHISRVTERRRKLDGLITGCSGRHGIREVQNQKHLLFQTGESQITFLDDQTITVTLEEFEQRAAIQRFVKMFANSVEKLLRVAGSANLGAKNNRVRCVLTGGGSTTPFVRKLFEQPMRVEDSNIAFSIIDPTPRWVEASDEALVRTYPQMAVAMGGCDPSLPKEVQTIGDITTPSTVLRVGSITEGYRVATRAT
jgi:hypothetical protein